MYIFYIAGGNLTTIQETKIERYRVLWFLFFFNVANFRVQLINALTSSVEKVKGLATSNFSGDGLLKVKRVRMA